jgi:hypothetical protein
VHDDSDRELTDEINTLPLATPTHSRLVRQLRFVPHWQDYQLTYTYLTAIRDPATIYNYICARTRLHFKRRLLLLTRCVIARTGYTDNHGGGFTTKNKFRILLSQSHTFVLDPGSLYTVSAGDYGHKKLTGNYAYHVKSDGEGRQEE